MNRTYSRVTGTGSYLPPQRVSNKELAQRLAARGVETSDQWIVERTGIQYRHFVEPDVMTSDLAVPAARAALQAAGCSADDVDLILVATSTPDMVFPSTAAIVQNKLGIRGGAAFDVQAVCSGFVYALAVADALIGRGAFKRALVIGAEVFSRLLNFDDRGTCVLFGDGAGAVVLQASAEPGVLACDLHADGRYADILCVPGHVSGGQLQGQALLQMEGRAVFKLAVSVLGETAQKVLSDAHLTADELDWLIPHQANVRIMQATARKLQLPANKLVVTVQDHGNTSAASVPLALDVAVRDGRIQAGHHVLLEGVGGGFTWGAVLLRW